jgi:pyruvate/2-oxoacid:ferredoxin oxidoreductase beta subunit
MTNTKGMETTKQTAVDWLEKNMWEHIEYKPTLEIQRIRKKIHQAKEMQKQQSQQYAEFCVMCDRENLPLLDFESYILKYGGNN